MKVIRKWGNRTSTGIEVLLEPRDAWVGAYVKSPQPVLDVETLNDTGLRRYEVYLCPVPFVVLHAWVTVVVR